MNHTMIIIPEMITNTETITNTYISKYKIEKERTHRILYWFGLLLCPAPWNAGLHRVLLILVSTLQHPWFHDYKVNTAPNTLDQVYSPWFHGYKVNTAPVPWFQGYKETPFSEIITIAL